MDVAWLGPAAPRGAVIVTSGTHGVEGYAGSGFQCALHGCPGLHLASAGRRCRAFVHALNPFGFLARLAASTN